MPRRANRALPIPLVAAALVLFGAAASAQLRVELQALDPKAPLTAGRGPFELRGRAELLGARSLDLFLVLDSSKSLRRTDPADHLGTGARALVWNLLALGRTRIGVVDVDTKARVLTPLTARRDEILEALASLDRKGRSNLAAGIRAAIDDFDPAAPDTTRAVLLFTDGLTDAGEALDAARAARKQGVSVHTVLLGFETRGETLLREVATATRGSFFRMTDAAGLSRTFVGLRSSGVVRVTLSPEGGEPVEAELAGTQFHGRLALPAGEHRIVATATAPSGATAQTGISVSVRAPGCAELALRATRDGAQTASLRERHVQLVLDASNSMWGRLQRQTKLEVAQATLLELLSSLPEDLELGLRAYGHRHRFELRRCEDSELLVPTGPRNREAIREAIAGLEPRGQTPLAHSLEQVAADLRGLPGERAVVLVTDGIESCGGDPVAVAASLQAAGPLPVHVIGFGLGSHADEDTASLRAIAEASGGRFLSARSARELFDALAGTVGTAFRLEQEGRPVVSATLGAAEPLRLDAGEYRLHLEAAPELDRPVVLRSGQRLTLTLEVGADDAEGGFRWAPSRAPVAYRACGDAQSLPAAPAPH